MSSASHISVSRTVLVGAALGLLAVGAGVTYVGLRSTEQTSPMSENQVATRSTGAALSPAREGPSDPTRVALPDVVVPLSKEWAERAGIAVTAVTSGAASGGLRAPGVVEPNAYKVVAVTPLIGGRMTQVTAELGQHVQRGQTIAQIFSPELAESQTRYISARAELEAHERELARTEKLVEIGSASRQELERIHAEHTSRRAGLQSSASRLRLLGLSESAIEALDSGKTLDATISVPAPIAGVVTERMANVGLNVDQATQLFTVVDLASVWVMADVYDHDVARIQIGAPARVTTSAYPNLVLEGRVSYVDPQVSAASRTARVRVEVPNARRELRLGMFVEVLLGVDGKESLLIPRSAVQNVGERSVVYFVNPAKDGEFVEREVRLGSQVGDQVAVLAGARVGDVVVSQGSFSVRAERERLGLRSGTTPAAADAVAQRSSDALQTATIAVGEQGYEPARVSLRAGVPARLTVTRTSDKTCGTEVVFPTLNIKRALPLNEAVVIEFTPAKAGDVAFVCGMNMLKGVVVVSDR